MKTTLEIESKLELVQETVEQLLLVSKADALVREKLELCLHEVINNAVVHGNAGDPKKRVQIQMFVKDGRLQFRISDEAKSLADNALDIAELPGFEATSGRGLALVKTLLPESRIDAGDTVLVV